jgi:hypothetical protein
VGRHRDDADLLDDLEIRDVSDCHLRRRRCDYGPMPHASLVERLLTDPGALLVPADVLPIGDLLAHFAPAIHRRSGWRRLMQVMATRLCLR